VVASKLVWQNMQAYQMVTNSPCPHIIAELMLVSKMDYAMVLLLVLVVNIDDAVSTEMYLICKEH
jgi:hypothetical protein